MKSRLQTLREIEEELNIRLRGQPRSAPAAATSWEFHGSRSFKQQMYRSGHRGKSGRGSTARSFSANPRQQRVIVKASYTAHHADKVAGVLRAHVKYLGRDSASLDGREGRFYDAAEEGLDARQHVQEWQDDSRHFRFIVSPERGYEINEKNGEMTGYVRELMQRVEKDLGTKLQWLAINHHNTDDLHAHVLVRGRRDDGNDLRIDRQYIQRGMRQAAQELATAWLGKRSDEQVRQAFQKEVQADRYTSLDALIERNLNTDHRLQLRTNGTKEGREQRRRVVARLQHLETMGLAARDRHGRWTVDDQIKPKLLALSQRNDIIKNLYPTLGPRSASVASYRGEGELIGSVAAQGTHDEPRDRRYLLVRDTGQHLHYVRVANGEALAAVEAGSLVRVLGADPQRVRTDARIAEMAMQNGGVYSTDAHRRSLPEHFAHRDVETFLQSHERRLATLERSGVATRVENGWRVQDVGALAAGEQARIGGGLVVVQVVSARSIESQIIAEAWTWLDRQMHRQDQGKAPAIPFDPTLEQAVESRRRWMIQRGYAAMDDDRYVLRPGIAQALRQQEWQQFQRTYEERFGSTARLLLPGAHTEGQYRGVVGLHDGLHAIVTSPTGTALAPVDRVPPLAYGTPVRAMTSTRGRAVLTRLGSRGLGQGKGRYREAERE